MRLSLRFIIPLFLVLGAIAYAVVPLVDRLTLQWFERDLDSRASLVANTVQEPLETLVRAGNRAGMLRSEERRVGKEWGGGGSLEELRDRKRQQGFEV